MILNRSFNVRYYMVEILKVQMSTDFLEKGRQNWEKVLVSNKSMHS